MTEEILKEVETPKCDCPICKLIRSDETKKFLSVVLASFIGCSLALLVFAPKKPHFAPKCPPPYMRMMDRPMTPHGEFRHGEFRHFDTPRHEEFRKGEFRHHRDFRHDGMKRDENFKARHHKLHQPPQLQQQTTPEQ